jgi:hypothetical protein
MIHKIGIEKLGFELFFLYALINYLQIYTNMTTSNLKNNLWLLILCFAICGIITSNFKNRALYANESTNISNIIHPCEDDECEGGSRCVNNVQGGTYCDVVDTQGNCKSKACGHTFTFFH